MLTVPKAGELFREEPERGRERKSDSKKRMTYFVESAGK